MKLFASTFLTACLCTLPAVCQELNTSEPKHLRISLPQGGAVSLSASGMQRDLSMPREASIIRMKGNVEIKTLGRLPGRYMVLLADEADYHEDTGEVEARGNVRVKLEAEK